MWVQEEEKPRQSSKSSEVIMWSNRGTTKAVPEKSLDKLIARGWSLAEPGTKAGLYNPIYDKGDNQKTMEAIVPSDVKEINITEDYLRVIEI